MGDRPPADTTESLAPMDRRAVGVLSLAHLFVDLCQGVVAAMLPFLVAAGQLTYAAGGGLVLAAAAASSVVQPLFGRLADRAAVPGLLPGSVLVTGLALAIGSQAPTYWAMAGLLGLSGLGVAAFHPEAARQARRAAGARAATGMSVFGVGGGLGFALAPPLTAGLFALAGRPGLVAAAPAAVVVAALLLRRLPPARPATHAAGPHRGRADDWGAFLLLSLVTVARSVVFVGLNTFLALYWMERYGAAPSGGAAVLGLFLGAGLTGTLLGGWLGDRAGHRAAVRSGFLLAAGLLPAVLLASSAGWAAVLLVPLAVAFSVPGSVLVVLGQEYLPGRVGVASGVTLGLSVSVGGMAAPLLGWAADRHGTGAVLAILEGVLAAAAGLSLLLPRPGR